MLIRKRGERGNYVNQRCFKPVWFSGRTRHVPVRHEHHGGWYAEDGGKQDEYVSWKTDKQPCDGNCARRPDHGDHPEQWCDDGYGSRFRKCGSAEPDAGSRCHHGCQYRYDDHGMDRLDEPARGHDEGAQPGILCAMYNRNRSTASGLCQVPEETYGRRDCNRSGIAVHGSEPDVRINLTVHRCADFCAGLRGTRKKSDSRHDCRCDCHSDSSEFIGISRYSSDTCA